MQTAFDISTRLTGRAVSVLKEKVATLNRRAARLGCAKIELDVGEGVSKQLRFAGPDGSLISVTTKVFECQVTGSVPKVSGDWSVEARMNIDPQGVVTFDLVAPGVNVAMLATDETCDHCKVSRRRRCIYFLRAKNDGNRVGQNRTEDIRVGSTCLESFLGCKSPAEYAWAAEAAWISKMIEGDDGYGEDGWLSGGVGVEMFPTNVVLAYALRSSRDGGYISRARSDNYERATVDAVSDMLSLGHQPTLTEAELDVVAEVRAAVAGMEESDYAFNVNSVLGSEYVTRKNLGIAVSAVSVLQRHRREVAAATVVRVNEHVGRAGERLELSVILEGSKLVFSDWGETCLYRLRTVEGHSLVWWCSGGSNTNFEDAAKDGSFKVKATVKTHGEFNGDAQTTVNRVTVVA